MLFTTALLKSQILFTFTLTFTLRTMTNIKIHSVDNCLQLICLFYKNVVIVNFVCNRKTQLRLQVFRLQVDLVPVYYLFLTLEVRSKVFLLNSELALMLTLSTRENLSISLYF